MSLDELIKADEWLDIRIPSFEGALNTFLDPDNLQLSELSRAENVRVIGDKIVEAPGYDQFRPASVISGEVCMDVISFELASGAKTSLRLTTLSLYVDNGDQWRLVPDGSASSTLDTNEAMSDTEIGVTDTTGFSVGAPISIELDNGSYHTATISSISAGVSVTINEALPSAASIGNTIEQGLQLTGDADDTYQMVAIPWADQVAITNNVDPVQIYDNTSGEVSALTGPAGVSTFVCKVLAIYNNALWCMNTTEDSSNFPQRVRASDQADITEWVNGVAYSNDLYESTKPINAAAKLGPYLIIYRETGIHRVSLSQDPSKTYDILQTIPDQGVNSPTCIVELSKNRHMLWGDNNFYTYAGGFDIAPIGDKIKRLAFGDEGIVDNEYPADKRLLHLKDYNEIYCVYRKNGEGYPTSCFIYKIDRDRWTTREFANPVRGATKISSSVSQTWDNIVGTWAEQSFPWTAAFLSTGSPSLVFASDDSTYQISLSDTDDLGVDIEKILETKDFSESPLTARTDYLILKVTGGNIDVYYSTDEGVSWSLFGSISASSTPALYTLHKQVWYESLRFRIQSTDPGFSLLSGSIRVSPESED